MRPLQALPAGLLLLLLLACQQQPTRAHPNPGDHAPYLLEAAGQPEASDAASAAGLDTSRLESVPLAGAADEEAPEEAAAAAEQPLSSVQSTPLQVAASQQESGEPPAAFKPATDRKPQLPVTSSHLKRPPVAPVAEQEEQASAEEAAQKQAAAGASGAKSLVSPSVESEEEEKPKRKQAPLQLADVLEPSQIMHIQNGSSLASIPAIVSKEYGHKSRTRITLGGGYVRERPPVGPLRDQVRPDKQEPAGDEPASSESTSKIADKIVSLVEILGEANSSQPVGAASSLQKPGKRDPRCPEGKMRTLEHPTACDRYFHCHDGYLEERVCPNGLMYGLRDTEVDFCVHRWKADCQDKSIPNPISSPGCRWQWGVFNVQGSPKCSPDFYECRAGKFEVKKCSLDGQVYDDRTKSCMFAEQVGCLQELLADFSCPLDDQTNTYWPFPRYFLNERALIHCINDKPQIVRCTEHERVDPEHLHCVPLASLPQPLAPSAAVDKGRRKKAAKNNR